MKTMVMTATMKRTKRMMMMTTTMGRALKMKIRKALWMLNLSLSAISIQLTAAVRNAAKVSYLLIKQYVSFLPFSHSF